MILTALMDDRGYVHHPATKMWANHPQGLAAYGLHACAEWRSRGYKDTQADHILSFFPFAHHDELLMGAPRARQLGLLPWWFGWRMFHESHRSNLLRKDDDWYTFDIRPDLPYVWPAPTPRVWKTQHSRDSQYFVRNPPKTWSRDDALPSLDRA